MKAHVVTLTAAIFAAGAGAAYAASETVTMNAIDANGIGKKIGTIPMPDCRSSRASPTSRRATMGSMSTSIRIVAPATGRTASQRPA